MGMIRDIKERIAQNIEDRRIENLKIASARRQARIRTLDIQLDEREKQGIRVAKEREKIAADRQIAKLRGEGRFNVKETKRFIGDSIFGTVPQRPTSGTIRKHKSKRRRRKKAKRNFERATAPQPRRFDVIGGGF